MSELAEIRALPALPDLAVESTFDAGEFALLRLLVLEKREAMKGKGLERWLAYNALDSKLSADLKRAQAARKECGNCHA
jgi:hypothetical protein